MSILLLLILLFVLPLLGFIAGAAAKNRIVRRISASVLCFSTMLVLYFFLALFGNYYLDRLFGSSYYWLPLAVYTGLYALLLLLIWRPFKARPRKIIALSLAGAMVLLVGVTAGIQAYENSFIELGEGDREIRLYEYEPFAQDTRAASLDGPSSLKLTDNLPRIDGATALYPLYAAFARATYPEGRYSAYYTSYDVDKVSPSDLDSYADWNNVICSMTGPAFENLINGNTDVAFLMDVSDAQRAMAEEKGLELTLTPIGREAFVFLVNSRNKVSSLGQDAIRAIYSGAVTDWADVTGGEVGGRIDAYQRPEGSGSQTALQKIMGDTPIMAPKQELVRDLMMGLYNTVAEYKNYKSAIGYSFRFYISSMLNDAELNQVRLLSIDGVAPTPENIASGAYPFSQDFYAVTVSNREYETEAERERAGNTQALIEWILSPQGQSLVSATGYVTVN